MSLLSRRRERRIIPRWRDSRTTADFGELDRPIARQVPPNRRHLELIARKVQQFENNRTVAFASDLVATALATGLHSEAATAAEFLLRNDDSSAAQAVAKRLLYRIGPTAERDSSGGSHPLAPPDEGYARIRLLKARVRNEPRNALALTDLALEYATLGQNDKAVRAASIALKIASHNRFILRSAARLFLHVDDADRALATLRRAELTKYDSWLISAEVGISDLVGRRPLFAQLGRRMLSERSVSAFHLSELASAIATLEAGSGSGRKARQLFKLSMLSPTENSVAQAVWASEHGHVTPVEPYHLTLPRSFEARANNWLSEAHFEDALKEARKWMRDQPFSRSPAIFATYVAGVALANYAEAIDLAMLGLKANPNDWILRNNLVFALASAGRVEEATSNFALIHREETDSRQRNTLLATEGLLLFRRGEHGAGRKLYLESIESLRRQDRKDAALLAALYLAREERLAGTHEVEIAADRVRRLANVPVGPEISWALKMQVGSSGTKPSDND